jgi:hypothetical protein
MSLKMFESLAALSVGEFDSTFRLVLSCPVLPNPDVSSQMAVPRLNRHHLRRFPSLILSFILLALLSGYPVHFLAAAGTSCLACPLGPVPGFPHAMIGKRN